MTTTDTSLVTQFNYEQLDEQQRMIILSLKETMQKKTVISIIAEGHSLAQIKEVLGSDKLFHQWVEAEYWFSYQTALKRIYVADMVDNSRDKQVYPISFEDKSITELYELAAAHRRPQIEEPYQYATTAEEALEHSNKSVGDYLQEDTSDIPVEEQSPDDGQQTHDTTPTSGHYMPPSYTPQHTNGIKAPPLDYETRERYARTHKCAVKAVPNTEIFEIGHNIVRNGVTVGKATPLIEEIPMIIEQLQHIYQEATVPVVESKVAEEK